MSWTAPMTAVANATYTAAQYNAGVRDNFNTVAPALATTPGSIFVTTAANTIAERIPQTALVLTSDSVSATSYANTTVPGPAVTAVSAAKALIFTSGRLSNSGSASTFMAHEISGATAIAAADTWALEHADSSSGGALNATRCHLETALTSGSNTFTVKYRVTAPTGTVTRRHLTVIPF